MKKANVKSAEEETGDDLLPRPGTASTLDSKVEEIFQVRTTWTWHSVENGVKTAYHIIVEFPGAYRGACDPSQFFGRFDGKTKNNHDGKTLFGR